MGERELTLVALNTVVQHILTLAMANVDHLQPFTSTKLQGCQVQMSIPTMYIYID